MTLIERICSWNSKRHEREFVKSLEFAMLNEEVQELAEADNAVDQLDALVDTVFVAIGSMYKLGLSPYEIEYAIKIVCDANDTKPTKKMGGEKVSKGVAFIAPEPRLRVLLKNAGVIE